MADQPPVTQPAPATFQQPVQLGLTGQAYTQPVTVSDPPQYPTLAEGEKSGALPSYYPPVPGQQAFGVSFWSVLKFCPVSDTVG